MSNILNVRIENIRVLNVVALSSLGTFLDLDSVALCFQDVEYILKEDKRNFSGLTLKLKRRKECIKIFKTGKIICIGATSEKAAKNTIFQVIKKLKEAKILNASEKPSEIKIVNIVASGRIVWKSNRGLINKLVKTVIGTEYRPDKFPAAITRLSHPPAVF